MGNNQINKDKITRLKGEYQAKYGYEMDDWTSVILYEVQEKFDGFADVVDGGMDIIDAAAKQFQGQIKQIHFNNSKEAAWFGAGQSGPICLAVCFVASLLFWVFTTTKQYEEKVNFIENSENMQGFAVFADSGKIITDKGQRFLVLKHRPKKGKAKIGRDYEYKTKLKEVWVPLGQ